MARIGEWMDLSELGDSASLVAAGWQQSGGNASVDTTHFTDAAGNGGSRSMRLYTSGNQYWISPIAATPASTIYVRFHFAFDNLAANHIIKFRKSSDGSIFDSLAMDGLGHLAFYRGDVSVLLVTSSNVLSANTWYTVEVKLTIGNPGSYEVRVNGASTGWIPAASGNTQPGAATACDTLLFYVYNGSGHFYWFDDLVADDTAYPGEGLVTLLSPNGAGATTQLTPTGSPNNWQNVDEIPPSDTDYNEATSPNLQDAYTHAALPASASMVNAALVAARVVKAGSTINTGHLVMRSGGTDYESPTKILAVSPSIITHLWETDPNDSAWTPTSLNAAEIGIRFDT